MGEVVRRRLWSVCKRSRGRGGLFAGYTSGVLTLRLLSSTLVGHSLFFSLGLGIRVGHRLLTRCLQPITHNNARSTRQIVPKHGSARHALRSRVNYVLSRRADWVSTDGAARGTRSARARSLSASDSIRWRSASRLDACQSEPHIPSANRLLLCNSIKPQTTHGAITQQQAASV